VVPLRYQPNHHLRAILRILRRFEGRDSDSGAGVTGCRVLCCRVVSFARGAIFGEEAVWGAGFAVGAVFGGV